MRPEKDIKAEIAKLKKLRKQIPRQTLFGESNIDSIDAEIRTLENRWTQDSQLAAAFLPDELDEDGTPLDPTDEEYRNESSARDAMNWMLGEDKTEAPSQAWTRLCK